MKTKNLLVIAPAFAMISCLVHDRKMAKDNPDAPKLELGQAANEDIPIHFKDSKEASEYLDLQMLGGDACKDRPCFFSSLEPELFVSSAAGVTEPTKAFLDKISSSIPALPSSKAIGVKEIKASFDLESSIVYGAADRLSELGLDQKCQANASLEKGSSLSSDSVFNSEIEEGTENLDKAKIDSFSILTDLKLVGQGVQGIVPGGSEVQATYKESEIFASLSASYKDFEEVSGKFKLPNDLLSDVPTFRNMLGDHVNFLERAPVSSVMFLAPPPGYPLPARGYGGDPNAFEPSHPNCNVAPAGRDCRIETAMDLCHGGVPDACDNPQNYPNTEVCEDFTYPPVSDYYQPIRSKRIVSGPATIQCKTLFPDIAKTYDISGSWNTTSLNAQWFISDRNWPGCGGISCPEKFLRSSDNDGRASDVEPVANFCVDRWKGLDYGSYLNILLSDCQNTQVFKDALAAKAATDAIAAFAAACIGDTSCKEAVLSISSIRFEFPLETIKSNLLIEESNLKSSKDAAKSYLITRSLFSRDSVQKMQKYIAKISSGLDKIESLRKNQGLIVDWNDAGNEIHRKGSIVGFSSYTEAKASLQEYGYFLSKIDEITLPFASDMGCLNLGKGRFRKYLGSDLKNVFVKEISSKQQNMKLLKDYKSK